MARKNTMTDLVNELEKVEPRTELIERIIAEARAGEFHDYKNQKYVCGKVAAVSLLRAAGQEKLALAIMNGEYDEEPDQDDLKYLESICPEGLKPMVGLDKVKR